MLKIQNLSVYKNDKKLLNDINIEIKNKEIVAIMGPNGSGKTTLSRAVINDPELKKEGKIFLDDLDITDLPTEEIAKYIYVAHQSPPEMEYIKTSILLKYLGIDINDIKEYVNKLGLPKDLLERAVNNRLSGGEKKKFELLLMLPKKYKVIILDEIDSGLDIDSLNTVNDIILEKSKESSIIIITHYTRIFKKFSPDRVYILYNGKVVYDGGGEIIEKIDKDGYRIFKD